MSTLSIFLCRIRPYRWCLALVVCAGAHAQTQVYTLDPTQSFQPQFAGFGLCTADDPAPQISATGETFKVSVKCSNGFSATGTMTISFSPTTLTGEYGLMDPPGLTVSLSTNLSYSGGDPSQFAYGGIGVIGDSDFGQECSQNFENSESVSISNCSLYTLQTNDPTTGLGPAWATVSLNMWYGADPNQEASFIVRLEFTPGPVCPGASGMTSGLHAAANTCPIDTISFYSNNNATAVYPQPGEVILGDSMHPLYLPAFFARVKYTLASQTLGKIVLQLTDQSGNPIPVQAGPPVPAFQGAPQIGGSATQCVGNASTTAGNCLYIRAYKSTSQTNSVTAVNLVALLEDASGNVLVRSAAMMYPVQAPLVTLTLGSGGGGSGGVFSPGDPNAVIPAGLFFKYAFPGTAYLPTMQAKYTYPGDQGSIKIVGATDAGGDFYISQPQNVVKGSDTLYFDVANVSVPPKGKTLLFRAYVTSSIGQTFNLIPISFPIEWVTISNLTVDPRQPCPCNTPQQVFFGFTVNYQTGPNGGLLHTDFSLPGFSAIVDPDQQVQGSSFVTRTYNLTPTCTQTGHAVFLATLREQGNPVSGQLVSYGFYAETVTIPAGASSIQLTGASLKTTMNGSPKTLKTGSGGFTPSAVDVGSGLSSGLIDIQDVKLLKNFTAPGRLTPLSQALPSPLAQNATAPAALTIPAYIAINRSWHFDPAIPADGSFAANLTLNYNAEDLPDDPNFSESAMQIISFDPSTGAFASYMTTVDTTQKTATAAVNALGPYYSLAVLGPFSKSQIDVPMFNISNGLDTRIALVNSGSVEAHLSVNGCGSDGTSIGNSPVVTSVSANTQLLKSLSAVGLDTSQWLTGWDQIGADSVSLVGAETILNGGQFDALPLATGHAPYSVLTDIEFDDQYGTQINLVNPAPAVTHFTITLHNPDGSTAGTYSDTLQPKATFSATVDQLFSSITSPFYGYATVFGDGDILASALLSSFSNLVAVAGHAVSTPPSGSITLYGPQLGASGQFTRVILVNAGTNPANLTLAPYKSDGTSAGKPVTTELAAGAQLIADLATLFGFDSSNPIAGSFTVTSDQPTVFGDLTFGDFSFAQMSRASVPLVNAGARNLVVPYVENDSAAQATINISNPNGGSASVVVTTLDSTGKQQGSASVTIPANGSAAAPITPGAVSGGYVTLSSNQPVVAFAVIAPASGGDFAAIPAQPVASVTTGPGGGGGPAPQITPGGVVNAADYTAKVSRGALAFAFGTNLASQSVQANSLPLPLSMGGASVTVAGIPAPVFVVNPTFIEFQIPYEVPLGASVPVAVTNGAQSNAVDVTVADYAVGVFTYNRTSTIVDPDVFHLNGTLLTPTAPAVPGETVIVIANGIGKLNNPPRTGAAVAPPYPTAVDAPAITIAGVPAVTQYAGLLAGALGVVQINVRLPQNLPSGSLPLVILSPGDSSPPVNLYVAGNAASVPKLSLSTNSLAFGNVIVGQSKNLSLLVSNTGSAPLTVSSVTISGTGFGVVSPATPFTVQPGGSQTVTLSYAPSSAASVIGTLTIISNDASSPASVSLSGTGVAAAAPAISVNPTSLNFGTVTVGQTRDMTVNVSNTGGAQLIVSSLTASTGFLVISPSTPLNVAPGGSSNVTVRFAPTAAVAVTGTLVITSNDPHTPTVTVQLSATGAAGGQLKTVVLQVDGGTFNSVTGFSTGQTGAVFVNRLTPASYPATLQNVEIYFGNRLNGLPPNTPITLVYGTNPSGSANFSATFTLTPTQVLSVGSLNTYPVTPVTITSGDFVVGFQVDNPVGIYPADTDRITPSQGRSYFAAGNYAFTLLDSIPGLAGNLAIRATVTVSQ